jgi:hypothetical protein
MKERKKPAAYVSLTQTVNINLYNAETFCLPQIPSVVQRTYSLFKKFKQEIFQMLKRNFLPCFFVILLLAAAASAQSFDLEGFYFIKSPVPAAFKNIDHTHLNGTRPNGIGGWIQLKNQNRFRLVTASLRNRYFSFRTARRNNVHYSFSGRFVRLEDFSRTQPTGVVLRGTLTKYRNGRRIASKPVRYTYWVGD